ncbi:MAG: zf-HC2 domain-containing protein [Thermoanaerobaculia bacterium]|nr:zf-HC2 domain-containing protein [Thermoanaerobaculia bacterium]
MSRWVDPVSCAAVDAQLDAYFDGELSELDRARVERHVAHCATCAETLVAFEQLGDDLRAAYPWEVCPPRVSAAVLELARQESRETATRLVAPPRWANFFAGLVPAPAWRPILVAAAAALVLAVPLWRTLRGTGPADEPGAEFTAAELAQAEQEARLVLALVASIGENAGARVREEILTNRIVEPTRRAFGFGSGSATATEQRP